MRTSALNVYKKGRHVFPQGLWIAENGVAKKQPSGKDCRSLMARANRSVRLWSARVDEFQTSVAWMVELLIFMRRSTATFMSSRRLSQLIAIVAVVPSTSMVG
jgi:hypothetical protein